MASKAKVTTDHEEIRRWAEERGGKPAAVRRTSSDGEPGILRIDFPGYSGEQSLEHISWDEWFRKFDENNLALLCQNQTSGGVRSNFNKIIGRETAHARARGIKTSRHHPARGRTSSKSSTRRRTTATASTRNRSRASASTKRTGIRSRGRASTSGRKKTSARSSGRSRTLTMSRKKSSARAQVRTGKKSGRRAA